MRSPAVPLAASFAAGLFASGWLIVRPSLPGLLAAFLLLASAYAARRDRLRFATALALSGYLAAGVAAGGVIRHPSGRSALLETYRGLDESSRDRPARIEGRLRSEPELRPDFSVLTLESASIRVGKVTYAARGGIRARVGGELRERLRPLASSDRVTLWGKVAEPSFFQNDGGFDGASWLARERLDLFASVKSALLVASDARGPLHQRWISGLRRRAKERLVSALAGARHPAGKTAAGVVVALVTGDRSMLSPEIEKLYRRAGIFHVMAISGAQVAIVALAFYFLLRRLGAGEAATLWTLLLLLPIYAAFCGSGPPVVRAALAAAIVVGARLLSLDRPHGNALAVAALILLSWQPAWLGDPGFQLSFAAMIGILWLSEPLAVRLRRLGPLASPLAVSIGAQAIVVPITAWHFHGFTWVAPLASLVAVPLSGGIVILGLLIVLFAGVPGMEDALVFLTRFAVRLLTASAEVASRLPAASIAVARPAVVWILLYYAALVLVRHAAGLARAAGLGLNAVLVVALVFGPFGPPERGALILTALDVGHGDALLLGLPDGRRVLIDGGGLPRSSFDVGERVVLPYLLDHGGRRLETVVVTHTDFDHLGGLLAIVEAMEVGEIWEGAPRWERSLYRRFRAAAERRGIRVRRLRTGETFEWGGAGWQVLAANGTGALAAPGSENERSLVLRIAWGESRLLLMGDAGSEIEAALLRKGIALDADVLKVGHHGSRSATTEAFLRAVRPELAIISGRRSPSWPLPSDEVLGRLEDLGIEYARTDRDGAVTVRMAPNGDLEATAFSKGFRLKFAAAQRPQ